MKSLVAVPTTTTKSVFYSFVSSFIQTVVFIMSSSFVTDGSDMERFVCLVYLPDPAHQLHVSLVQSSRACGLVDTIYRLFNHFLPLSLYPHRVPAAQSKRETFKMCVFLPHAGIRLYNFSYVLI